MLTMGCLTPYVYSRLWLNYQCWFTLKLMCVIHTHHIYTLWLYRAINLQYNFENIASIFVFLPRSSLWTVLQMWLEEYSDDFRDAPMHSSLRLMCLQLRGHAALFTLAKHYEILLKKFQGEGHCWIIYCE